MNAFRMTFLVLLSLSTSMGLAAGMDQLIKLNDPASSWVVYQGQPVYYSSETSHYQVTDHIVTPMNYYDPEVVFSLSPHAKYRLITHLESLELVKHGKRYSNYVVLDQYDEVKYRISKGSGADLKASAAAVSDEGILALVDPISAQLELYQEGKLITETPLYETEGDYSLEREVRVHWWNGRCYILIERPGQAGSSAADVLFISINAQGLDQVTKILPFTYLQRIVFKNDRIFVSGYSYDPDLKKMSPLILETDPRGNVIWISQHFGHELAISQNGAYLAARSSHNMVRLFNLLTRRMLDIKFEKDNKVTLGLNVDNSGRIALIRVASDFFVKRNTHFAEIFFPQSKQSLPVQMDPQYPQLFQLYSDGSQFYLGTQYEWLEISE